VVAILPCLRHWEFVSLSVVLRERLAGAKARGELGLIGTIEVVPFHESIPRPS
jgi:hypothetical protein